MRKLKFLYEKISRCNLPIGVFICLLVWPGFAFSHIPFEKPLTNIERLRAQQHRFVVMLGQLIGHATLLGYDLSIGDAYRDPRVHGEYGEDKGYGSRYSDHKLRLAIDLNLFHDNKFLSSTEDHRPLGEYWESIGGFWGGRVNDGNHYALPFFR